MSVLKKIFIFSVSLFVVVLLLWGIYNLSFKKPAGKPEIISKIEKQLETPSPSLENKAASQMARISDDSALSPTISENQSVIKYYSKKDNRLYQMDFSGQSRFPLSKTSLPVFRDILWSPDKTKFISESDEGNGQLKFRYYDLIKESEAPLKSNLDSVVWQNNGKIFYKYYDQKSKERSLNIASPDGNNWEKIMDIPYKNVFIAAIPKSGLASFWTSPDGNAETVFQSVSVLGKESKNIQTGKFGADYLWNNDGSKALVSHLDSRAGSKLMLATINSQGGEYKNLEIPTFVSKCIWSKDNITIYYALPGSIPDTALLPNDYLSEKFHTADTFWKVNTQTGEKTRIVDLAEIPEQVDASDLFLSSDEGILFFVDRLTGHLFRINL